MKSARKVSQYIGLIGVVFMHVLTNWPLVKGNRTVMTAVYFCGMAATVVLTFGVYGTLDAVWGPPMSSFVPSFGLLRMDMDFLSFSCFVGRKSFTGAPRRRGLHLGAKASIGIL